MMMMMMMMGKLVCAVLGEQDFPIRDSALHIHTYSTHRILPVMCKLGSEVQLWGDDPGYLAR
jgi:hypothetical protein